MVTEAWERVSVVPDRAAGCDEAGRGPLAGNVIAAAVILDNHNLIEGLADSKKLSQKKRELLYKIFDPISSISTFPLKLKNMQNCLH